MDRNTRETYKRGALFVLPVLAIVGCRVGCRACVALERSESRRADSAELAREREAEQSAALAAAAKAPDHKQEARARAIATAAAGYKTAPIASAQQVPDALAMSGDRIAWLSTRGGEVVVAPRGGGAPRVVAKDQKLPLRRHVQGLALGGGWVWWITTGKDDTDGAVMRAKIDGGDPETVIGGVGGLSAIAVDKDSVYFARGLSVSRDEDGGATGGVYRLTDKDREKKKEPTRIVAAERPCAIAVDDAAVYVVETLQIWRAPLKAGKAGPQKIVSGSDRLGCSLAIDDKNLYWTLPSDDSLMRAKKTDGSAPSALAFLRKRPWNVVVDRGYAYVLTETSPQALGELGNVFRVPLRAESGTEAAIPEALVTDQVGLNSIAASGGYVVISGYNESENDGTVIAVEEDRR